MDADPKQLGGRLQFRIWVTRGCFFILSDRLKRKSQLSIGAITFMSFYVVVISLITFGFADQISFFDTKVFSTFSIVLSIFIIIITLLESSKEYSVNAEYASQIGHSLEDLHNRYENFLVIRDANESDLPFRQEYSSILKGARVGRKSIDYHYFKFVNIDEFEIAFWSKVSLLILLTGEIAAEYWIYFSMIFVPPGLILVSAIELAWKK